MAVIDDLFAAAVAAQANAYAPYSRFKVGAAVLTPSGRIFAGCNVENAAYPQGSCAEAGAIAAMALGGERRIEAVAVVGDGDALVTPCGGCRQRIREFAGPDALVHVGNPAGAAPHLHARRPAAGEFRTRPPRRRGSVTR